jgi:hypothetical protein
MPTQVTVDLQDLKLLVKLLLACSIESRAQRAVRISQSAKHKDAVRRYVQAVNAAVPEARKDQKARYRDLLNSLKTGDNVRQSLATFVAHEAKSSTASDT